MRRAAERADAMLEQGDLDVEAVWLRILRAIRVILSGRENETLQ
jgi:hypothetical protein